MRIFKRPVALPSPSLSFMTSVPVHGGCAVLSKAGVAFCCKLFKSLSATEKTLVACLRNNPFATLETLVSCLRQAPSAVGNAFVDSLREGFSESAYRVPVDALIALCKAFSETHKDVVDSPVKSNPTADKVSDSLGLVPAEKGAIDSLSEASLPAENGLVYRAASQTAPVDCVYEAIEDDQITERAFDGLGQVSSAAGKIFKIDSLFHVHCPAEMGVFDGAYKAPFGEGKAPVDCRSDVSLETEALVDNICEAPYTTEKTLHNLGQAPSGAKKAAIDCLFEAPSSTGKILKIDSLFHVHCPAEMGVFDGAYKAPFGEGKAPVDCRSDVPLETEALVDNICEAPYTTEKALHNLGQAPSGAKKAAIDCLFEAPSSTEKGLLDNLNKAPSAAKTASLDRVCEASSATKACVGNLGQAPSTAEKAVIHSVYKAPSQEKKSFVNSLCKAPSATEKVLVCSPCKAPSTAENGLYRVCPAPSASCLCQAHSATETFDDSRCKDPPKPRKGPVNRFCKTSAAEVTPADDAVCEALSSAENAHHTLWEAPSPVGIEYPWKAPSEAGNVAVNCLWEAPSEKAPLREVPFPTEKGVVDSLFEPSIAIEKFLVNSEAHSAAKMTTGAFYDTLSTAERPLNSLPKAMSAAEKLDPGCLLEASSETERAPPDGVDEIPYTIKNDPVDIASKASSANQNFVVATLTEALSAATESLGDSCGEIPAAATKSFVDQVRNDLLEIILAFLGPIMDESTESPKTPADRLREARSAGKKAVSISICRALFAFVAHFVCPLCKAVFAFIKVVFVRLCKALRSVVEAVYKAVGPIQVSCAA